MDKKRIKDLLDGARQFDPDSLAEIYDLFSPGLYAYGMRLLGETSLAEECVSETFSRLLKALKAGAGPKEYLQAYLYRIAHNWITDRFRRQDPPSFLLEDEIVDTEMPDPEAEFNRLAEQKRIRKALRLLTPEQRQVVVLRFIEGWENEEVASALEKPVGAVKALQHRALQNLRKMLHGEKEVEGEKTYGS
jgi:RNA polymerase sigma-70 factor (ECF subfamily)